MYNHLRIKIDTVYKLVSRSDNTQFKIKTPLTGILFIQQYFVIWAKPVKTAQGLKKHVYESLSSSVNNKPS